jgi:hypothetical protein
LLFFSTRLSFIHALSSRVCVHAHAFIVLTVDDAGSTRVAIGAIGVGGLCARQGGGGGSGGGGGHSC